MVRETHHPMARIRARPPCRQAASARRPIFYGAAYRGTHEMKAKNSDPQRSKFQDGKIGYILLWLLGVPIPILLLFYFLRGCT